MESRSPHSGACPFVHAVVVFKGAVNFSRLRDAKPVAALAAKNMSAMSTVIIGDCFLASLLDPFLSRF